MKNSVKSTSRRSFLKNTIKAGIGTAVLSNAPFIVPASVFGKNAPSNRINIGAIGNGRISTTHDMPGVWKYDTAQIVAVCDLDSKRVKQAKDMVEGYYTKKSGKPFTGVKTYENYEELLASKDIDAVLISTPDHWHVLPALKAVRAKKDVYMQKPASLTVSEGRLLSDEVKKSGRIFQIGSQQRSMPQFKRACELVRNGRIGQIKRVVVGLPIDDPKECTVETQMPVPGNLNYDKWLGSTPEIWYTEKRVHPQEGYGRPGWLRCQQFGAGMITGWGVHHFDIVNWGLDTELTGPVEFMGKAQYPDSKYLWNVHGPYNIEFKYANGIQVIASNEFPNGVKFEGTEGWIFVTRGNYSVTASDPVSSSSKSKALDASDPKILTSVIGPNEIQLYDSKDHHGNWLECIQSRKQPITPIEVGHRACSICLVSDTAMKLGRTLNWDPKAEKFKNDNEANASLSRPQRKPYQIA